MPEGARSNQRVGRLTDHVHNHLKNPDNLRLLGSFGCSPRPWSQNRRADSLIVCDGAERRTAPSGFVWARELVLVSHGGFVWMRTRGSEGSQELGSCAWVRLDLHAPI